MLSILGWEPQATVILLSLPSSLGFQASTGCLAWHVDAGIQGAVALLTAQQVLSAVPLSLWLLERAKFLTLSNVVVTFLVPVTK